ETVADLYEIGIDRFLVRMNAPRDAGVTEQTVDIDLVEPVDIGAEFVRWEIATAVAGALLRINPFDEPNVQQAKDATRRLLDRQQAEGRLPIGPPGLTPSRMARQYLGTASPEAVLTP